MSKKQRLDKVLANMGYGSRREVRSIIKSGLVSVNNKVILENGYKVDPYQDLIYCKGEKILYRKHIYLMMNKPKGL
ncbi:MAG TPA: S4 domain-containing protein, partial [Tissierellaceae bacterium]|nr:S4 domain-containing protein [Tissierellaceae bacterium]